jgi:hypothetical protein
MGTGDSCFALQLIARGQSVVPISSHKANLSRGKCHVRRGNWSLGPLHPSDSVPESRLAMMPESAFLIASSVDSLHSAWRVDRGVYLGPAGATGDGTTPVAAADILSLPCLLSLVSVHSHYCTATPTVVDTHNLPVVEAHTIPSLLSLHHWIWHPTWRT